ncbi:MAG: hypothetical protein LBU32_12610 [Clostridiales bacterium]|nr:hypothetical protein [Clostridiales bacterium]
MLKIIKAVLAKASSAKPLSRYGARSGRSVQPSNDFEIPGEKKGRKVKATKRKLAIKPAKSGSKARLRLKADIRGLNRHGMSGFAAVAPSERKQEAERTAGANHERMRRPGGGRRSGSYRAASGNRSLSWVSALFFTFVLVYIVQFIVAFAMKKTIKQERVQYGTLDVPKVISGIIIREESVYKSPASGTVTYLAANNERVKKGSAVCVIEDSEDVHLQERADENLLKLQEKIRQSGFTSEQQKINLQLKNLIDSQVINFISSDMEKAYSLKDALLQNINIRNNMFLESSGSYSLDGQMLGGQSQPSQGAVRIEAVESGLLSNILDGYEERMTPETMGSLALQDVLAKVDYGKLSYSKEVAPDQSIFKIVTSNEWHIAAYAPNELVQGLEVGEQKTIYLNKNDIYEPMPVTIENIVPGDGESFILYKSTRGIIDYMDARTIEFKTVDGVRTGYKIPASSITEKTLIRIPKNFVVEGELDYIQKEGEKEKLEIFPVYSDEGAFYAPPVANRLAIGDALVNESGESVKLLETAKVSGVYRTNYGTAEFRRVILDGISQNSGYYILDPAVNKTIQAYDLIVYDASSVEEEQIIY